MEENSSNGKRHALFLGAAFLIACGIVFGAYHSVLNSGFLLDDFKHLGYAYNANHGDTSGLMHAFTGNWTGQTDGLTSFRPGISLSFWLDNLLFGLNAVGYHITNLVVFSGCTFLCGLLGYQLTADAAPRERFLTGLAAIILFATYPIHAESVSWIIGRVDVHCTFFYLCSISLYLQFRKAGSIAYFLLSIATFLASLICKEMAVTLPVVIALAEVFLSGPLKWQDISIRKKLVFVGSFFGTLLAFGAVRTMLLGTVVGGYGNSSFRGFFRAFRNNFFDTATFGKILMGVNEEQPFSSSVLRVATVAWLVVGVSLLARLVQPFSRVRVMGFLLLWLLVAELPTFQIWHIFPNLVGSRLFFLGSSAMCLLLAVSLIPALRISEKLVGDGLKKVGKPLSSAGVVALMVLPVCWYLGLAHNLYPWIEAGRQMQLTNVKLLDEARSTKPGQSVMLIDLPQDFSGAGMIGRHELLESMLTKPVAEADHASKFVTLVRPIPGPIEYIYPDLLATIYGDPRCAKSLHWSKDDGGYVDWTMPEGAETLDVSEFPSSLEVRPRKNKWKNGNSNTSTTAAKADTPGAVANPTASVCVWLSKGNKINPLKIGAMEVEINSSADLMKLARNARLVWRSQKQPKSWIDYSEGPGAEVRNGKLLFMPARYRSWVLNGSVVDVGIQFLPGQYSAQVRSVRNVDDLALFPAIDLVCDSQESKTSQSLQSKILPIVNVKNMVTVSFDASKIAGAKSVVVVVTKTDIACPDLPVAIVPDDSQLTLKKDLNVTTGSFQLPPDALAQRGKHQVAVLALDGEGKPAGFISEPRTYFVE